MEPRFASLGRWLLAHRLAVLIAWIAVLGIGAVGARQLPGRLFEGSSAIPGSPSDRMEKILGAEFDNPFTRLQIVALESEKYTVDDPIFRGWIREVVDRSKALPQVQEVASYLDAEDDRFRSKSGHQTAIMVGMRAMPLEYEQKFVPELRQHLANLKARIRAADPAANLAVTGRAAILYDIDSHMKRDGQVAETWALPLSMVILLLAFGALVAAGIPLIIAMVGVTVAMGLGFLLTLAMPISGFIMNVVTMIGLAVGIDYALLMVSRFRTALTAAREGAEGVCDALVEMCSKAGPPIVYSGLTVMISLSALVASPLIEFRSIGLGGFFVVVVSVIAAITLVPVVLSFVGRNVDAPRWLSQRLRMPHHEERWHGVANWVMDRPWRVLIFVGLVLLALASPTVRMDTGFSNSKWFPRSFECRQGIDILSHLGQSNSVVPIYAVVRAPQGDPILQTKYIPRLYDLAREIRKDPRVGEVLSPVSLREGLGLFQYLLLYRNPETALSRYPQIKRLLLSKDRAAALFQIIPGNDVKLRETQALARDIAKLDPGGGLTMEVGGEPVYYSDFTGVMAWLFPLIVGSVIAVTVVVLFLAFRSFLLPIKAVVMNLLSVGVGFGVLVMVFQFGWGSALFGMAEPMGAVPITIPTMIFCITFGLSMDYEVFLLTRIKEIYDETGDNRYATAEGLATTGGIITNAALIMVVVFGAFAFVEMPIGKMIGLGLATTVLVDATLVRVLLVPAFMRLAGRWNWIPGSRRKPPAIGAREPAAGAPV